MKKNNKTILVPTDFTVVAGYALQHAVRVASVAGEAITLLHVVANNDEVAAAKSRLESLSKETFEKFSVLPETMVGIGEIASEISRVSYELGASLVIMGSQSVKGKENLTDLRTLNVITKSKVPFITIQEPPINKRYDDIVFPIDFTVENKEKHSWISYFCDYYVSKFHLIKPNISDPELLAKIDLNMASAVKCLDEKGAKYEVHTVSGKKLFAQEVLEKAVNIRADLIVIMTTRLSEDSTFILEPHEQFIIGYAGHIPVMSINPQ